MSRRNRPRPCVQCGRTSRHHFQKFTGVYTGCLPRFGMRHGKPWDFKRRKAMSIRQLDRATDPTPKHFPEAQADGCHLWPEQHEGEHEGPDLPFPERL